MSLTIAEQFTSRLLDYRSSTSNTQAMHAARMAVIDTIAVTLLGSTAECSRIARATLIETMPQETGNCRVYGSQLRCSVLDAAHLNGIASHADDFDDFTDLFGGHPSVPVVPALLSLAEHIDAGGFDILHAYIAGVELENRIAMGVHFHHYEKGWHPTSTLGVFGAAAACAQLLKLNFEQTVNALAIAASFASGLKANFGSMTKPMHVGHCSKSGLYSALLAKNGFTAQADVFENKQGFFEVYNGAGNFDVTRMMDTWFEPAIAVEPGASIKQFPCCGSTHQAAYMAIKLITEHQLKPAQIEKIDLRVSTKRLPHTNNPNPRTGLEAKFSVQYVVARTLVSGVLKLSDFEPPAFNDETVRSLMRLITVSPDPTLGENHSDNPFGADLTLTLNDGIRVNARTEHLPGRGADYPMSSAELLEKFMDCASRVLDRDRARQLFEQLESMQNLKTITYIADLMVPGNEEPDATAETRDSAGSIN